MNGSAVNVYVMEYGNGSLDRLHDIICHSNSVIVLEGQYRWVCG